MPVQFHLNIHDGPLDVLLALIKKNEINIYDIPISEITEQFLDYIHSVEEIGLADLSDFYKMAADLIYIKSRLLIASDEEIEFSEDYEDPRSELVEQLIEYSRLKKLSELLAGQDTENTPLISRKEMSFILPFTDEELFENIKIEDLFSVFVSIIKKKIIDEKVFNVFEEVTEQEKTALMFELLENRDSIMFTELFKTNNSALHIICSFMAVLDAVKAKSILVKQIAPFKDILIIKRKPDWDPALADEYDEYYDTIVSNNLEDEDNFSIIKKGDDDTNGTE